MKKLIYSILVAFFALIPVVSSAEGVAYPVKTIEMIVPFAPGGDTDLYARILAKHLEKELGKTVIVVNVTGGSAAALKVKNAKPDGYSVLYQQPSFLINKILGSSQIGYNDFEVVGMAAMDQTNSFSVSSKSNIKSIPELIAEAKKRPGEMNVASGLGNISHMMFLDFQKRTGTKFNIIDVGGGAEQKLALLSGRVSLIYTVHSSAKGNIDAGDFRLIGMMSEQRHPQLPNIPTFREQGVDMVYDKFFFVLMTKGTPNEIVEKFTKVMGKIGSNEGYKKELGAFHAIPKYMPRAEAVGHLKNVEQQYIRFKDDMQKPVEKAKTK
jgi:tripartite-type tricarboxylate transporter receptor subunit TctC